MNALGSTSVAAEFASGNVPALLHEIRHGLARLLETGESTFIDLRGIPLAPGEEDRIIELLGTGEARAVLEVLGRSEICESAYPGIWIVTHYDEAGSIESRFVEVTSIPDILRSQESDMAAGLARLEARLAVER